MSRALAVQQNDPSELLEVFDAAGRPSGRARTRAAIHVDGDWHLAFHCWILRRDGQEVVLQRRSLLKDTYPGYWDAAAAGHWRFGESPPEAAREIAEELGLDVRFEDLVYRGRERTRHRLPNGLVDREFHEVYVLRSDHPLAEYRPDPSEVSGLAAFPTDLLIAVVGGAATRVRASEAMSVSADGRLMPLELSVSREDLVPYSAARLRRMIGRRRAG